MLSAIMRIFCTSRAAHIVPHSIGEMNAAYLFGCKMAEGYDVIWRKEMALCCTTTSRKPSMMGEWSSYPHPTDDNEFISIIRSQDLLKDSRLCAAINAPYSVIHQRRLRPPTRKGEQEFLHSTVAQNGRLYVFSKRDCDPRYRAPYRSSIDLTTRRSANGTGENGLHISEMHGGHRLT